MIFLLITFLAWAILSMGMLGIDWGYATWSQARLHAAAQTLALDSLSDHQSQPLDGTLVLEAMGIHASTSVQITAPDPITRQVHVSRGMGLPLRSLSIGKYVDQQLSSLKAPKNQMSMDRHASGDMTEPQYDVVSSAMAQLRPARQVGIPRTGQLVIPGVLPCVLERKSWEALTELHSVAAMINALGEVLIQGKKVGQFNHIVTHIGQKVQAPEPLQNTQVRLEGYVPIFQRIGQHDRVVGFGHAQIQGMSPHVSIIKHVRRTRSHNTSTQLTGDLSELSQEELIEIFESNQTLTGAVLAPILM